MKIEYNSKALACYNKNLDTRRKSTSGGIFSLIADYIVNEKQGYVCGALFDEELNVIHTVTNDSSIIKKMRGSKYPQSMMGDSFIRIKELLNEGKYVLFTGTPCQVYGLKCFLKKDYEKLHTLDFVCHGVASPGIWKDYIRIFHQNKKLVDVCFKHKVKGWKKWHVKYQYEKSEKYCYGVYDPFMRSYLSGINHRPSCYSCKVKGIDRNSDFTIADCWGEGEKNNELNDDKGLSALLLHNEKAVGVFEILKNNIIYQEYEPYLLMKENWACFACTEIPLDREEFFEVFYNASDKEKKDIFNRKFGLNFRKKISYIKLKLKGKII